MPRTVKGRTRFPYRIVLVPETNQLPPGVSATGTQRWKRKAIYNVKMRLTIQAHKAARRARWQWYQFYCVRGYGAPSTNEFICPYSGMVAKTIDQQEAASIRKYWVDCTQKTREVIEWLELLPPHLYTRELNHFLLRLIFIQAGQREIKSYKAAHPFDEPKPWRELLSTTSYGPQPDGPSSRQRRRITELPFAGNRSVPTAL